MNKALYIIGVCLAPIYFFVISYYISAVSSARMANIFSSIYSNYSTSYSSFGSSASELTENAGVWNLIFLLFFAACAIVGMLKLKTKTSKIMSIVAVSLTGIFLLWNFLMLFDSGAVSFDEVGGAFVFFDFFIIAYMIVQLVQTNVYRRLRNSENQTSQRSDVLDF